MNFFVINNPEGINKEFWIESNHDILSCLVYHNIRIHGAKAGIELQLHVSSPMVIISGFLSFSRIRIVARSMASKNSFLLTVTFVS